MGWTWIAGSTWGFSDANYDSYKLKQLNATLFVKYPRNIIAKFSVESFWMDDSNYLFAAFLRWKT